MVDFFYKRSYNAVEGPLKLACDHEHTDVSHGFGNGQCALWAPGLTIAMHTLADKYDIPALMDYTCTRLEWLLRQIRLPSREDDLRVIGMVYQHTRSSHEMRRMVTTYLISQIKREPGDGIQKFVRPSMSFC